MLGGIAGHAALFSTALDVEKLVRAVMWAPEGQEDGSDVSFLNATTAALFTAEYNHSQSSRALGWDTNDPENGLGLCGDMGARTFTHTGCVCFVRLLLAPVGLCVSLRVCLSL